VNEGGLKESIIHKKTGFLISQRAEKQEIIEAVKYLSDETCESMKQDCILQAHNFSL